MGSFSCGMWTLSCSMRAGSSSPTRNQTRAPCIGSAESYPLGHQGSPSLSIFEWEFPRAKWKGLGGRGKVGIWVGEEAQNRVEMKGRDDQGALSWMVAKYDRM